MDTICDLINSMDLENPPVFFADQNGYVVQATPLKTRTSVMPGAPRKNRGEAAFLRSPNTAAIKRSLVFEEDDLVNDRDFKKAKYN